jgi:hypothetical protein
MIHLFQDYWKSSRSIFLSLAFFAVSFSAHIFSVTPIYALTPTIHSIAWWGNWSDANTWIEGRIPTASDVVEIDGTITLDTPVSFAGLRVLPGDSLLGYGLTVDVSGDVENEWSIALGTLNIYGNLLSTSPTFSLQNLSISWPGERTLQVHGDSQIGNVFINTDIALIGDLNITWQFTLQWWNFSLSLQDWHGITTGLGFYNGSTTLSWNNTFLKTRGYVSAFTITGSLDRFIFDGKPSSTPSSNPVHDFHLYESDISAKNIDILSGSLIHLHASSQRNTLHAEETLHIHKGWSLLVQTPLTVVWNMLNEGEITGWSILFLYGNFQNLGPVSDTHLDIFWNAENSGSVSGHGTWNIYGNLFSTSPTFSLQNLSISWPGERTLQVHGDSQIGNTSS